MLKKDWPVIELFELWVDCLNKQQLLDHLDYHIQTRLKSVHLVTMNAEMAYSSLTNPEFKKVLLDSDIIIPDGIGVVWALRHMGIPSQRLPGVELVQSLFEKNYRVFLLGSKQDTLDKLLSILPQKYPLVQVVGAQNGYFSDKDEEEILTKINQAKPDILLVALGVPRQEIWINRHLHKLNIPVKIGVGGSFDVLSGNLQRAPEWMQKNHMEWLYRLLQEPTRWRRMLALPQFVIKVLQTK